VPKKAQTLPTQDVLSRVQLALVRGISSTEPSD
jgi:hypothetical protein